MVFTYTSATPTGSNQPAIDRPLMTDNFQYLGIFGPRDHQFPSNTGTANVGTHKQVTLTNLVSSPGFANADCVLYSQSVSGTSELFFDNGTPVQLTSSTTPAPGQDGRSYLPGGVLLQWNQGVASPGATITFTVAFSGNPWAVFANCSNATFFAGAQNFSTTDFKLISNAPGPITYQFLAIGPV